MIEHRNHKNGLNYEDVASDFYSYVLDILKKFNVIDSVNFRSGIARVERKVGLKLVLVPDFPDDELLEKVNEALKEVGGSFQGLAIKSKITTEGPQPLGA